MGQKVKITTKKGYKRKVGGDSGYHTCTRCGGTGRVRNAGRPRKK